MSTAGDSGAARTIGRIVSSARKKSARARAALAERFIRHYFANVPPAELSAHKPDVMAAIALGQLNANETRRSGKAGVRLFNPVRKTHGYTSERSVIEVVTDDMPFIVDSVTAELSRQEIKAHSIIHPTIPVARSAQGKLRDVVAHGTADPDVSRESFIHIEITQEPPARLKELKKRLEEILLDVRHAVEDWRSMRHRMWALIEELETGGAPGFGADEVAESRDFLRWIHDNHFTFLGYRDYTFNRAGKKLKSAIEPKTGLGILRDPSRIIFDRSAVRGDVEPESRVFRKHPALLMVTKTNVRTTVHRPVHMDVIAIKRLDDKGRVTGQRIFVGLFTSVAYNRSPREIPLLRQKLDRTVQRAGFRPASHDGKNLIHILETYPRDELFQVSDDELYTTSMGILHLQERARVALFVRRDDLDRYMSCLVFVPRDRFNTQLRMEIGDILADAFNGTLVAFRTQFGDGPLARVHFIVRTASGKVPNYDADAIEARLVVASRSWKDSLSDVLGAACSERETADLMARFGDAFGLAYQAQYGSDSVVEDIETINTVIETGVIGMNLYTITGSDDAFVRFKLYHPEKTIPLSDALPLFEHMGFRIITEASHRVETSLGEVVMIHDFGLEAHGGRHIDCAAIRDKFHDAFFRVWYGQVESDSFNGLVCQGGLTWREVVIIRACCKYLRQARIPYSQSYMEQTMLRNAPVARMIVRLFQARFDPSAPKDREKEARKIQAAITSALESVSSADEDRIIRRFVNVVDCTVRTNFYQVGADGHEKSYLSLKLKSRNIEELPLPRPFREIFVYSPRVEGVHLRFGMVARGGLRWSDRPEDFRTEILGLVKAQQVKNSVIVPVGSKGGFVLKQPPKTGGREALMEEGVSCYKLFISALLDITDNYKGRKVTAPKRVVRHDGDDPYLVVAADKGTATFSDYANGVSIDYGHWLGDAFASGGSQGYDHKGMGITARGAWESVKRHFREIGTDIQNEDFSVIGVGDMSGDVFGNGMLLSRHIRLVGAFNHLHIFVDPNPDPAKTWVERKRLFDMGRSGWADYDKKLLSKGAALYERSAKTITLAPEIRKMFGLAKDRVTPNDLLRAMLQAEVDLLWFGGIGTYIKAAGESHADVGDRANDAIRVNGREVRARVIGEGANLGATQPGRIEYAQNGGRLNTDAIDNSAGVDCSDHEVNIKILIDAYVESGKLNMRQRNRLLARMTDEVGELVLTDNYQQSQAITLIQSRGVGALEDQMRLMRFLERQDRLNRAVEYLPDDEAISERMADGKGLTRPELSVVLSYSKIWLYDEVLASDVPDDGAAVEDLVAYFPTPLRKSYRAGIENHRLRREIIATVITNSMVNRVGDTFVYSFMERTGLSAPEIVRAFVIARDVYGVQSLWDQIESLDNRVSAHMQTAMLSEINGLLERATMWYLQNGSPGLDFGTHIEAYASDVATLMAEVEKIIPPHYVDGLHKRARPMIDAGVPKALAIRIAGLVNLAASSDIVRLAQRKKLPVIQVAKTYFAAGTRFKLGRLRAAAEVLGSDSHWQQLAVDALIDEIFAHQLNVTAQVLDAGGKKQTAAQAVETWISGNAEIVGRAENMLNELWSTDMNDLSMIAVASRQLRTLSGDLT